MSRLLGGRVCSRLVPLECSPSSFLERESKVVFIFSGAYIRDNKMIQEVMESGPVLDSVIEFTITMIGH